MPKLKLGIVQDYVPRYRLPFFEGLLDRLSTMGIECIVIAGVPYGSYTARSDAARNMSWLRQVPRHELSIGRNGPRVYGYATSRNWRDCDGVIHSLRGTAIDLHMEILTKSYTGRKIGVWGHIGRNIKPPNGLDKTLERWQMHHSDYVFGYTQECAEAARAAGMPAAKVTAVMNSVDVEPLLGAYRALKHEDIQNFIDRHSMTPGKIFGFIGGLDSPKRIDFLAGVLDRLWRLDPDIKLVIGGTGDHAQMLTPAEGRGQVVMLGYSGPSENAMIMRIAQALVNPGRIGLLAVEALATGIPILTTDWNFHAPEFDYLSLSQDVLISSNSLEDFTALIFGMGNAGMILPRHSPRPYPSIDGMVENFALGVQRMFSQG